MNIENLVIYPLLEGLSTPVEWNDLKMMTLKNIEGISRPSWVTVRGRKTTRDYTYLGKLAIQVVYTYEMDSEGIDISDITGKEIRYYFNDGTYHVKDITPIISHKRLGAIKREIWMGQIDYLKELSRSSNRPEVVAAGEALFSHYSSEIIEYEIYGSKSFNTALDNETNPTILYILSQDSGEAPTPEFPKGFTILESIKYQTLGIVP